MKQEFLKGRVTLYGGDCMEVLATLPENSVDSVVTDPPYHFASIVKRFGASNAAAAKSNGKSGVYKRASRGFMGKTWDGGQIAHEPETWAAVLRVLKPGGHLVAFHAPKNWHRQACAIEDAGFEIRDNILWLFGSGFPKSHNLTGEYEGWGTALKPAYEPIVLARKPFKGTVAKCVPTHGTGALNIDGCRIGDGGGTRSEQVNRCSKNALGNGLNGGGKTSIDLGRWPANVVHDGSTEVLATFPDAPGQQRPLAGGEMRNGDPVVYGRMASCLAHVPRADSGSAARFFYSAKADAEDRLGSKHPTVKPIDLMRWLVRLITPPGGTVLDPFAGTGTTGQAAWLEGNSAILIEREEEYRADIQRRCDILAGKIAFKHEAPRTSIADGSMFEGIL